MFDSQNARGRDLVPRDLLKGYHLREFSPAEESLKGQVVAGWEACESDELANLFSERLYRVRQWSRGAAAREFSKDDIGLFKGVNMDSPEHYPHVGQLRMAHHFVDHYNTQ